MFESALDLFDRYTQKMLNDTPPGFEYDLAAEVRKRIRQLDFLYERVDEMQLRHNDLHLEMIADGSLERRIKEAGGPLMVLNSEPLNEMSQLMFEIELFTESFYYLAGRMRTILKKGLLPNLGTFECVGARDVRNKLLEHADGRESKVYVQSFGIGGDQGATLKIERPRDQEAIFPDAGIYANAEEIRFNLERVLRGAL